MALQAGSSDKSLREEDVKVYKATATGPNGFITMLDDSYATISDLELRKIEFHERSWLYNTSPQVSPSAQSFIYRVPQLEVCKFDGEILKYIGWKERMKTAILERNDLPDDVKIQLTIDRLEGKAAKWVQGIKIEGRNLQLIWSILDEHGGNDSHYKIALHKELQGLSCHNEHVTAARAFYDELESILRQLEYSGESAENNYHKCLMAKLPRWILNEVLNSHHNGKVKDLRKKIHELIMKREEVDRNRALYQASGRVNDNKSKDKPTKEVAAAVTTNSNSSQKQTGKENKSKRTYKKRDPYCILCEEKGHWASECPVHKTSKGAYEKIVANKRCTKCTRKGIMQENALNPQHAASAKKTGHRELTCRLRDQASNRANVAPVIEQNAASVTSTVAAVTSTVAAASNDKTEILLLSSEVTIANPVNRKEAQAFAFLDTGSQSSFIADHVANKLQLQPVRTRTIEFDNPVSQAKTMRVKEYEIKLLLEDGSWTLSNQEVSITKGPMKAPEILLGTESYGELTNQPKHEATGFRIVKTKLGTLLSGSGTFVNIEVVAAIATNEEKT
uniref:CCHC-type domain-containing protein n=1 Tax=Acrobeloides nanus TaxID=290746 RepID=A0A914EHL3_9BILA